MAEPSRWRLFRGAIAASGTGASIEHGIQQRVRVRNNFLRARRRRSTSSVPHDGETAKRPGVIRLRVKLNGCMVGSFAEGNRGNDQASARFGLEPRAGGTMEQRPDSGAFGAQLRHDGKDAGVEHRRRRSAPGTRREALRGCDEGIDCESGNLSFRRQVPAFGSAARRSRPGCIAAGLERPGAHGRGDYIRRRAVGKQTGRLRCILCWAR